MANRPYYPGWPPPQQQGVYGGMSYPQRGFRPFPPPVVYPMPGVNNNFQGWSPYPQLQGYGNGGIPGQHVVQPQLGFAGVLQLDDVRPVKPLFLSWIEDSAAADDKPGVVKSSELYKLVDRVEGAIEKILALTQLQDLGSEAKCLVCPFDPRHVVPAEALLRHTLRCRSSVEASSLLESLQYPSTADPMTECSSSNATLSFENVALFLKPHDLDSSEVKVEVGTDETFTTRQQFDPRGSSFFYGDAPGVVVAYASKSCGDGMSSMPHSLRVELEKSIVLPSSHGLMLPSMVWDLGKELEAWKDMPSQCSRVVIQAATCLGRVRKAAISKWLLAHSPAYGVVLDVAMAAHISSLVQLYLKALRTQSLLLKRDTSVVLECSVYAEASTWLASWLSHLYGPIKSKSVVLDVLKHCLKSCGKLLSAVPLEGGIDKECNVRVESEDVLGVKQVGAAMDAIYERANFERYITSWMSVNNATKPQRITSYDLTVVSASHERAKRRNYHAVCEHDGLTWQRSQQEEKRNKSRAELLAEERDYKRRRMSYRGKKLKRTPLQVLHDIIENHMAEITEAGGIGCFYKQPPRTDLESQQQEQGGILSRPNIQHHSGSAHDSKMSNSKMAGDVQRLHDGLMEASSSGRTESRPSSERRFDDERHRSSKR